MKKFLILLTVLLLILGFLGYDKYQDIFGPNVPENLSDPYLLVPTGSTYPEVVEILNKAGFLRDSASFIWVAKQMSFDSREMRPGRFEIQPNWSNRRLIQHLRGGKQASVRVVLTNERLLHEIAGKAAKTIEADSTDIMNLLTDPAFLRDYNLKPETALTLFIPNTYEFFWNSSARDFVKRMKKEHDAFWEKKDRINKAEKRGMTPAEVYTAASIVDRETNQVSEMPRIAGLYLNRLDRGILLQADPTVVFATGEFGLRRVLYRHLEIDSPYNTYKYAGLPPGPISMASIAAIDAVLNREEHDYIFMCAKGDGSGFHSFAKTNAGHGQNIKRYQENLKKRGLR